MTKEEYNELPVHFCKKCLSLAVMRLSTSENRVGYGVDYCNECGNTVIGMTHIGVWEDMYKEFYDKPYIVKSKF